MNLSQDEILKLAIKHGIIPMRFIVDTYEAKKSSILAFAKAIQGDGDNSNEIIKQMKITNIIREQEIAKLQNEKVRLDSEVDLLRKQLNEVNSISYSLTAKLCMIGDVGEKHGHTIIRRESVMDAVVDWRHSIDKISKIYHANIIALKSLND